MVLKKGGLNWNSAPGAVAYPENLSGGGQITKSFTGNEIH